MSSRLDQLYDRFYTDNPRKLGTKYERLCAVVAASLEIDFKVQHDLRLLGQISDQQHQIDVVINDGLSSKRIIIECKDFDVKGDPVGIGIIRDFYGLIADVKPDEAWVMSCNGYTKPARKYAKAFNIKLITLRDFREQDWAGRVRTIIVSLTFKSAVDFVFGFECANDTQKLALETAFREAGRYIAPDRVGFGVNDTPIFINLPNEETSTIFDWINAQTPTWDILAKSDGAHRERLALPSTTITIGLSAPLSLEAINVDYRVTSVANEVVVDGGNKVATMLMRGLGDSDQIIWDDTFLRFKVNAETGDVISLTD